MKNKTKIIYIIPSLDLGGAERLLTEIIKNINKGDFEVGVICLRRTGFWARELQKIGVKIDLVGSVPKFEFLSILKIRNIIKREKPDIVHTHLFGADVYGGIAALSLGVKNIISTEHNLNYSESSLKRRAKSLVINKFDKVIAVSDAVRSYAIKTYGINEKKIITLHNGIHYNDYFKKVETKRREQIVVGSVGRLSTQKGFERLILAMKYVENKNIVLKIAGDGNQKYELRHLIKKHSLEERVKLVGPQKDISKFYADLDIYVQSSAWEGLGISILEAGAAGLPVIASNVDGIKEIVESEKYGYLYHHLDCKDLAAKIDSLSYDALLREKLAQNLQTRVYESFSLFQMIKGYEDIYKKELGRPKKILLINKYHYLKGGAERAYFDTAKILEENGNEVAFFSMDHPNNLEDKWSKYFVSNVDYNARGISVAKKIKAVLNIWYNFESKNRLKKLIKEFKPDIAHLHNIYHQISPSVIDALHKKRIPVVHTLHDYKLISPNYSLMHDGKIWEKSKGKKYYKCVSDKCVKNSYHKSFVCAIEAYLHDILGIYKKVETFISPSRFLINKFREFGFKGDISYLPNPLPFEGGENIDKKKYFLYFGRLSQEKGVLDLIRAYSKVGVSNKLYIAGEGEEREKIEDLILEKGLEKKVILLGYKTGDELQKLIREAFAVVVPSRWYENAPYSVVEAMFYSCIVLASRIGGLNEMITEAKNGYLFDFGQIDDLAEKIRLIANLEEGQAKIIQRNARKLVQEKNSREVYYKNLLTIYNKAANARVMKKKKKYYIFRIFLFTLLVIIPMNTIAIFGLVRENKYPKLANYFLKWELSDGEARELAKWDLLVLDMENQINSREQLRKIRQYNPEIIILAYITAGEIRQDACNYNMSMLRCELYKKIKEDWYLHDASGARTVAWPGTNMLNFGSDKYNTNDSWNDTLAKFAYYRLMNSGVWDGVFYDTVWHDLYWVNNGKLDVNNDGRNDNIAYVNERYKNGLAGMLSKTRNLFGDNYIILENGSSHVAYQSYINGMMYESFPTPWEGAGYWPNIMKSYLEKAALNRDPKIQIINANSRDQNDLKKMREGLGNALLGNAYYSFDFGETNHGQTWWYPEYEINLGAPISNAYRIDGPFENYEQGLWRRDFELGAVFVNSYDRRVNYDIGESMIKKDFVNNTEKSLNRVELGARDSVILFKNDIPKTNTVLKVGSKVKESVRNIVVETKNIVSSKEEEIFYRNITKNEFIKIFPKTNVVDSNNDALYEKVIGASRGEESSIKILDNKTGRLLGVFGAYPKEFRCGVKTAIGDFDSDGKLEIATVPAWGGAHLKVFNFSGGLEKELFFQDKSLRANYDIKSVYDNRLGRDTLFITNY